MIKEKSYVRFISPPKHPEGMNPRKRVMEVESYDVRKILDMIPETSHKLHFFKKLHGQEGDVGIKGKEHDISHTYFVNGTVMSIFGVNRSKVLKKNPALKSEILSKMKDSGWTKVVLFENGHYEQFKDGDEIVRR